MIVAIIQARMGSTRLPGKVLKKVLGRTMLEHLFERLRRARSIDKIVLATTNERIDDPVAKLAKKFGIETFRGSENDVLDRYYQAAKKFGAVDVVRITGDCPLMDPAIVDRVVNFYKKNKKRFDDVSNVRPPTYPDGMDVEVLSFKTLESAWRNAKLPSEREHVTAYITNHPEIFRIGNVENAQDLSALRLTLDNAEDFGLIGNLIRRLTPHKKYFGLKEILAVHKKNPQLFTINDHLERNAGYAKSLAAEKKFS